MKAILTLCLVGSTWLFQPSTHKATKPQAPRRQRTEQTETYTNQGFRRSRSTINVGGYVQDNLFLYETWRQQQ